VSRIIDPLKSWVIVYRKQFRTIRDQHWRRVRTHHPYNPRFPDAIHRGQCAGSQHRQAGPTDLPAAPHRHILPFGGDRSALVPQRVSGRLRADQAVAKHKSVDAIVRVGCRRISGPLQEQQVAIEDLGLQRPGCVRQITKQLGEPRPDTLLATQDPAGCDEDRVIRIIGDDLVKVAAPSALTWWPNTSSGVRVIASLPPSSYEYH
jgi:hypothetical protein